MVRKVSLIFAVRKNIAEVKSRAIQSHGSPGRPIRQPQQLSHSVFTPRAASIAPQVIPAASIVPRVIPVASVAPRAIPAASAVPQLIPNAPIVLHPAPAAPALPYHIPEVLVLPRASTMANGRPLMLQLQQAEENPIHDDHAVDITIEEPVGNDNAGDVGIDIVANGSDNDNASENVVNNSENVVNNSENVVNNSENVVNNSEIVYIPEPDHQVFTGSLPDGTNLTLFVETVNRAMGGQ